MSRFLSRWETAMLVRRFSTVLEEPYNIENVILLTKMTRFEMEHHNNPGLDGSQLERLIRSRGSDYDSLLEHHNRHKAFEHQVVDTFNKYDIKAKLQNRLDYTGLNTEFNPDAIFSIGGDGTFLLAASKVRATTVPVIGLNSDPRHSEGFLCVPGAYSSCIPKVIERLKRGQFKWLFRSRIRVSFTRNDERHSPIACKERDESASHRVQPPAASGPSAQTLTATPKDHGPHLTPPLALNEVFIGESSSAQVSYFEMRLKGTDSNFGEVTKVKSSGLCLCTGTGSTSWHLSMNRMDSHQVAHLLRSAGVSRSDYQHIADAYNASLLFDPEDENICYTVRDLISAGVWPSPPGLSPRGFSHAIWIRSRCKDARLVVDGGMSYQFNEGSEAVFEIHPEDDLKTITFQ